MVEKHTSSWEEVVPVFVEGYSHDSVCEVKRLLNTIPVMNINVDVEHAWMIPKQKYYTEDVAVEECINTASMRYIEFVRYTQKNTVNIDIQ